MTPFTYTFQTSQPLTDEQLEFLNYQLHVCLPSDDDGSLSDYPEFMTDIELVTN